MLRYILTKNFIFYSGFGLLFIIILASIGYMIVRPTNTYKDLSTVDKGLSPIRILQVKDGKETELNFTKSGAAVLAQALISEEDFVKVVEQSVKDIGIDRVELPPLYENRINVIPADKLNDKSIDNYLTNLYNVFRDNNIQPNINQLSEEALEGKTQNIQSLLRKNTDLYLSLFLLEVPPDALNLHKYYIRIAQIQNSFLLGLLNASSDPFKLDINNKISVSLLQEVDILIKQELQILRQKYNLIYQR
jgi:hypothetical protein